MKQKIIFYKYAFEPVQECYLHESSCYNSFKVVDNDVTNKEFLKSFRELYPHVQITKPNVKLLKNHISANKKKIAFIMEDNTFLSDQIKKLSKD